MPLRDSPTSRRTFAFARRAERGYAARLKAIARQIGEIVNGFSQDDDRFDTLVRMALGRYAEVITPWARSTAGRVVMEIARRDEEVWQEITQNMGRALQQEIRSAPTGKVMQEFMNEQVTLITSLPLKAAQRVHQLTIEGITNATRASEIAADIRATGKVTESRAKLIARTEVSRTASALTAARAIHVGSTHYIWRSSEDTDVRPLHRKLNGKVFAWDDPPITGERGERSLPGGIYNCRCYPEVILPKIS